VVYRTKRNKCKITGLSWVPFTMSLRSAPRPSDGSAAGSGCDPGDGSTMFVDGAGGGGGPGGGGGGGPGGGGAADGAGG